MAHFNVTTEDEPSRRVASAELTIETMPVIATGVPERRGPSSGRRLGIMDACIARQSHMRLHSQLPSRSDGGSRGRRETARTAREPLTASRRAGYCCATSDALLKPDSVDPSVCQKKS